MRTSLATIEENRSHEQTRPVFHPTAKMKRWVQARCHPDNIELSDHALAKKVGFSKNLVRGWLLKHQEEWLLWFNSEYERRMAPLKDLLRAVGVQRALDGDFRYWREMAVAYGVIAIENPGGQRRRRKANTSLS